MLKTKKQIKQLFDSFDNYKVLVIGDVMLDAYLWGSVERISPEAPVPIIHCNKRENRLGGAANVALNVQALGATPILCSVIGKDEKGDILKKLVEKRNLSNIGLLSNKKRRTTIKSRIISSNQHLLRVDEEDVENLQSDIENEFIIHIIKLLKNHKISTVIFEDYDKGVITKRVIEKTVSFCQKKNIPILVDPKKRNFNYYNNVTLLKPNFKEFIEGLNIDINKSNIKSIFKASKELSKKLNSKYIMITLSELGVFIFDNDNYFHIQAEIRDIADVSGAGDTVISTAALCLAAGLSSYDIAKISNLAGGLVCEKVGVVPINKKQLLKECIKKL